MVFALALAFIAALVAHRGDDSTREWARRGFAGLFLLEMGVSVSGAVSGVSDAAAALSGVV